MSWSKKSSVWGPKWNSPKHVGKHCWCLEPRKHLLTPPLPLQLEDVLSLLSLPVSLPIHFCSLFSSVQSLSRIQLCDSTDWSTPGFPVHHQLPELTQTLVHWVSDAIQPAHPLLAPSPPAFNHSQHRGLFQRVSSSHQVAKVLEFQLQHQSFQWIFRTEFL